MGTGSFPGVKRPGRGVDHPPPSCTEVKERPALLLPLWAFVACPRVNIIFFQLYNSAIVGVTQVIYKLERYRDAAMMSMRRKISGRTPAEIKRIKKEDVDLPVTMDDFEEALSRCKRSVSLNDVSKYESWMEEFGSC